VLDRDVIETYAREHSDVVLDVALATPSSGCSTTWFAVAITRGTPGCTPTCGWSRRRASVRDSPVRMSPTQTRPSEGRQPFSRPCGAQARLLGKTNAFFFHVPVTGQGEAAPEAGEAITRIVLLTRDELWEHIDSGAVCDAFTLQALGLYEHRLRTG